MSLVKPLFVASIASLILMMTSMSSTTNLLQQMGIRPTLGTCNNCSSPTGVGGAVQCTTTDGIDGIQYLSAEGVSRELILTLEQTLE